MLATANPVEYEGTYPLPEAQLDRFLLRVAFGYPTSRGGVRRAWPADSHASARRSTVEAVTDAVGLRPCRPRSRRIEVDESVGRYCVDLADATRSHPDVLIGASPRGALGLVLAARGCALIRGRDYVIPEDVKAGRHPVLAHRITVKPELWMTQASGSRVVEAVLSSVTAPGALERR